MGSEVSMLKVEKLTDRKIHTWKQNICLVLSYIDLEAHIEGDESASEDPAEKEECFRQDRNAMYVIFCSLSDEYLSHVNGFSSPK